MAKNRWIELQGFLSQPSLYNPDEYCNQNDQHRAINIAKDDKLWVKDICEISALNCLKTTQPLLYLLFSCVLTLFQMFSTIFNN